MQNKSSQLMRSLALLVAIAAASAALPATIVGRTVRLLTVGNSFSQNSTRHLANIAKAAGHTLIHHACVIPGGTMAQHCEKIRQHDAGDARGLYPSKKSLKQELLAEPWDVVTIQQASILSHDSATYQPHARQLVEFIRRHRPSASVAVHQTWAYRQDDPRFARAAIKPGEPATQREMYEGLTRAYAAVARELNLRRIPVGDAFFAVDSDAKWCYKPDRAFDRRRATPPALPNQSHSLHVGWRWVKAADGKTNLQMDGHHANLAGEYLGGCVFFEFLFDQNVVGNSFVPRGLDADFAAFLQETAHRAVQNAKNRP